MVVTRHKHFLFFIDSLFIFQPAWPSGPHEAGQYIFYYLNKSLIRLIVCAVRRTTLVNEWEFLRISCRKHSNVSKYFCMIKTVYFDFDGVLTTDSNGSGTICKNLLKIVPNVEFDDLYRCYRDQHSLLLTGNAKHADIWDKVCSCLGKKIDIALLYEALKDAPKNEQMFKLAQALRKNYRIGIITDNTKERFDAILREMKLVELFDLIILSADVGSRKDERHIFEAALKAVNAAPEECVFIDNQERNLVIPSEMGFSTFFHDDKKNDMQPLLKQLKEWGITVDLSV